MQLKLAMCCLLYCVVGSALAVGSNINQPPAQVLLESTVKRVTVESNPPVIMSNLGSADNDASDLIKLKRKLDVEKAQAEIKKLQHPQSATNNTNVVSSENAQTVVTGVAINQDGKKIAWLQFADGGSLTVNIGSQVGRYRVSDISMVGVKLSSDNGKGQNVFLRRVYYSIDKTKSQQSTQRGTNIFSPSPIITNANNSSYDMVPPIVTDR